MAIKPDTKDWTWVLDRICGECGVDTAVVVQERVGANIRTNAEAWRHVLSGGVGAVTSRPEEDVWSPLEYACHVRDVHRVFAERVRLMLEEADPTLPGWDQDAAALGGDYSLQDPARVASELMTAAADVAAAYDGVSDQAWERTGRRGDGASFTVASLARYHLHDLVHHLHDVGFHPVAATVSAYDAHAAAYAEGTAEMPDWIRRLVDGFVAGLPAGARVLEIGSGPGRDAKELEVAGLSVRRTDIAPGFVEVMRAGGHDADVIDPLHDDLADPGRPGELYDGVWASGSLLHVLRADLPTVLRRLAEVTRPEGLLRLGVKEGDGEAWSTRGRVSAPRHFTFWREEPLREVLEHAGWRVVAVEQTESTSSEGWLNVAARRG